MESTIETSASQETSLQTEIARLRLDTYDKEVPPCNFDPFTGEDLKTNEPKKLLTRRYLLLRQADLDMADALGHREEARFHKKTGEPIPQKILDEKGKPTEESLKSRLDFFRKDVSQIVNAAKTKGLEVPNFDSQTGERVPPDSLWALEKVRKLEEQDVESGEMASLKRELELGINALKALKMAKLQVEEERQKRGLPPEK